MKKVSRGHVLLRRPIVVLENINADVCNISSPAVATVSLSYTFDQETV
jgi:hypothetical protein